jgi:hypothetical protein
MRHPGRGRIALTDSANDAAEIEDRRFCGFLCRQLLGVTLDAVCSSEGYGEGFAAELRRAGRDETDGTLRLSRTLDEL